jgi:hypothetical protein
LGRAKRRLGSLTRPDFFGHLKVAFQRAVDGTSDKRSVIQLSGVSILRAIKA